MTPPRCATYHHGAVFLPLDPAAGLREVLPGALTDGGAADFVALTS
jgi:hypothetical protein